MYRTRVHILRMEITTSPGMISADFVWFCLLLIPTATFMLKILRNSSSVSPHPKPLTGAPRIYPFEL